MAHRMIFRRTEPQTPALKSGNSLFEQFDANLSQKEAAILQSNKSESLRQLLTIQYKDLIPTLEEEYVGRNRRVRTAHRKLCEEDRSFRAGAAEVKKEVALHLMKNRPGTITEVAELMGYNDLAAFRRAFKGWTKETPKAVKKQLSLEACGVPA